MTTIKDTNSNSTKSVFYNKASNILIYKSDKKRKMSNDQKVIDKYRDEVVEKYNVMAALAAFVHGGLEQNEKEKLTQGFEKFYKPRLILALNYFGFQVDVPAGFETIDPDCVDNLPEENSRLVTRMMTLMISKPNHARRQCSRICTQTMII